MGPKIMLSTLQVVYRGGRIRHIAGEMGRDVRGLECHVKQLSGTLKAMGRCSFISCSCDLGTQQSVSQTDKILCLHGVYGLIKAIDKKQINKQ